MNFRALASTGSILSALASSACCWLPLLLMVVGLSASGIGTFFENSRPLFLIIAAVLLGLGFYLNNLRNERCEPNSTCERPNPWLRKMNRGMLWVSTALVLSFAFLHVKANDDAAGATITVDSSNPPTRKALAAAVGKTGDSLVSMSSEQSIVTEPDLAGHWITELEGENGERLEIILDLGVVNSRWVGEFDLPKYNVMNYPVEVKATGDVIELFLTAISMSFKGTIDDDGMLTGVGHSPGVGNEPISLRRTGSAEFSEGFLELEAAADDRSLVEILSDDGRELRARFNADREKTRLLMLLSPT